MKRRTTDDWFANTAAYQLLETLPADLLKVQVLAIVVEDNDHVVPWDFLLDDLRFVDTDGTYPELAQAADANGNLKPQFEEGLSGLGTKDEFALLRRFCVAFWRRWRGSRKTVPLFPIR